MCKDTTKKSNEQTELFISDAFRVEKPVKVSFTAPELSNLGGLSLVAKCDKESGLCDKFASLIPEWRNETLLVHSLPQLVRQRVYQIAAGFEDADDCDDLRHDSICHGQDVRRALHFFLRERAKADYLGFRR